MYKNEFIKQKKNILKALSNSRVYNYIHEAVGIGGIMVLSACKPSQSVCTPLIIYTTLCLFTFMYMKQIITFKYQYVHYTHGEMTANCLITHFMHNI